MLLPREALAHYHIQELLDQAERARLAARLRSLRRAHRAAMQETIRAAAADDGSARGDQVRGGGTGSTEVGVSTIELFFDLVFVFAITQLTSLLARDPTVAGLSRVLLIFGNLWWIYGGYAWLTNAVPPRPSLLRFLMLLAMGGFLVVALAIPTAFGDGGLLFGLGYLLVTLVHTGMFLLSSHESAVQAMRRLGPANTITAALLLLAAFTDGALQWSLWTAAFGLHWISPFFTAVPGFPIRARHFVERHGLIVLIGLGESIVAVGIGLAGRQSPDTVVTAVLGLTLAAVLWWLYFDGEPVTASTAWLLAASVAVYIVGLAWFRRLLDIGPTGVRLLLAAVVLATAIIGLTVSPQAQLATLAALLIGGVLAESAWMHRTGHRGSPAPAGVGLRGGNAAHALQAVGQDWPAGVGAVLGGDDLRGSPGRLGCDQGGGCPHR